MKNTILFCLLFCCFSASAQHDYISSSGTVILTSGSIERYLSPDIYVTSCYDNYRETWVATLKLAASGVTENFIKTHQIEFSNATIDALTCTGATNTEDIKNCMLQAVEDYLSALNGGTTFTLN